VSISRRMFLASIPALYAALSNVNLDTEAVKVLLPEAPAPLGSILKKFLVEFPDGGTISFDGFVTQLIQRSAVDSITTVSLEVVPTGEVTSTPATKRPKRIARDTVVQLNGESLGDVLSIEAPRIERTLYEVYHRKDEGEATFIQGVKRIGPLKLELAWDKEFDVRKLMGGD
jgi:hypothetical protein